MSWVDRLKPSHGQTLVGIASTMVPSMGYDPSFVKTPLGVPTNELYFPHAPQTALGSALAASHPPRRRSRRCGAPWAPLDMSPPWLLRINSVESAKASYLDLTKTGWPALANQKTHVGHGLSETGGTKRASWPRVPFRSHRLQIDGTGHTLVLIQYRQLFVGKLVRKMSHQKPPFQDVCALVTSRKLGLRCGDFLPPEFASSPFLLLFQQVLPNWFDVFNNHCRRILRSSNVHVTGYLSLYIYPQKKRDRKRERELQTCQFNQQVPPPALQTLQTTPLPPHPAPLPPLDQGRLPKVAAGAEGVHLRLGAPAAHRHGARLDEEELVALLALPGEGTG